MKGNGLGDPQDNWTEPPVLDVWGLVVRQKWMLVLGVCVGLALGYLHSLRLPQLFQSQTRILIVRKQPRVLYESLDYQHSLSHTIVVPSPLVVGGAVEQGGLGKLPSLMEGNPVGTIIGNLRVAVVDARGRATPGGDSEVLDIHYSGSQADDCRTILESVVASYRDFLDATYQSGSDETIELIQRAKDELHRELQAREAAYREFRDDSPLLWEIGNNSNIHSARLAVIENQRTSILVSQADLRSRIDALETARRAGIDKDVLLLVLGRAGSESGLPGAGSIESQLKSMDLEKSILLRELGKDHPKVQEVDLRMQALRVQLDATQQVKTPGLPEPKGDFLTLYLRSLAQELVLGEARLGAMNEIFEQERAEVKKLDMFQVRDQEFQKGIGRVDRLFEVVMKRLEEMSLLSNYGGYVVQSLSEPDRGTRVDPGLLRILLSSAFAGLLGGMAVGFLVDRARKIFHSPEDIRHRLSVPVLAHIPAIPPAPEPKSAALDPILCAFHTPMAHTAEAYRGVRAALFYGQGSAAHKVIQVTSPSPSDGKTTLIGNLGISIAQSGKRVVLVDADLRRPRIHKLFGSPNEAGLASVLLGESELCEVVQPTPVSNLWVLPSGSKPTHPAELLTSPRFGELIEVLRDQYDFVLVDTSPVLSVTDPSVVATHVDGVLLVLRLAKKVVPAAVRTSEILASVHAKIVGIVVNNLGRPGYPTADHLYGYGYGYRYYDYGYGYGSSDGKSAERSSADASKTAG